MSFRSSLQTFAERAMLRTANAHKKVLDQIDQAAERQSYMHVMCCTMEPQALSHLVSQLPVCSSGVRAPPAPWQQPLAQAYSPRHALFLSKRHCARRPAHDLAALQPSRRIQARNRARALLHGVASSCSSRAATNCCRNGVIPAPRARRHVKSQVSTGQSRVLQSNRLRSACRHRGACAAAAR